MSADTLSSLFRAGRPANPDVTPLVVVPGGRMITYADADRETARLAGALRALGARPGDRVAVHIEKSPAALLLYLAALRAGLVYFPMNPAYTPKEVAYLTGDARPSVFVTDPGRPVEGEPAPVIATIDGVGGGTLGELALEQSHEFEDAVPAPSDLVAMLYTSGTTGRPKGAALTQRNLASNAAALRVAWGFRPDDFVLHALPMFHAHGLFVAVNLSLANGTGMLLLPRFDVDAVLEHLPRCTVFMGVPTFYARLLADPRLDRARCAHVRLFLAGSAPLAAATHDAFRERTGHAILERYGMTETLMITSNPLDGERRPGSVGRPLPGVDLRVHSASGAPCGVDEVGEVEVRSPGVFPGYWDRPDQAAAFTPDGWFRTGDLGALDADGYLHLAGRSHDLIISGGMNVYPKEIETAIDALDGVAESAVIGAPDEDLGEIVVAIVCVEPGATIDPESLRTALRSDLADFKVPKRVHLVESLPRNAIGKVEKTTLRATYES